MGKSCIVGGTFTYVHAGHLRLLEECKKFSTVKIGLTSDSFVKRHKLYPSLPYHKRLEGLKKSLKRIGLIGRAEIFCIEDEVGGADRIADAKAIVVSEETYQAALRINKLRKKNGLEPLKIISVPLAYGEDLKKISCASIYEKKTDLDGKLLRPLSICIGSDNPTKVAGTKRALGRIFGKKFSICKIKVESGVSDHPFNGETFKGAKNRAHAAWRMAGGKCDYAIGMESGLFNLQRGMHIDITVACVYDGEEETYGTGMGFVVPEKIAKRIKGEKTDLTKVLEEVAGVKNIGRRHGAIGYFSAGVLHRSEQIEQSVLCAFVPRLARAKAKNGKR
ncbi:MAG: inosine/xanthosine triphosphatase [Candidatus Micrarchaeota archaeon]|nr:inosine/xanthosine triphosphatase [Candidatus Micrarchaeota archaeon]